MIPWLPLLFERMSRNFLMCSAGSQKIILIIFVHICMYTFENKRMRMQPRNFGETQNRFYEKWP